MSVVVTGASGFVGQALCARLGAQARPLSLRSDPLGWPGVLHGADCVVHLAARVHMMRDRAADQLAEYRAVNCELALQLARVARQAGVRRLVYMSSVKVLGESTLAGRAFSEQDVPAPQDPYGVSKWEAEQALLAFGQHSGLEIVIVRPPLVYGPGVRANFASLLALVARGVPMPLAGIDNRRSLVALDNLVDLVACCAIHPQASGQIFLVSDGDDVSTPELVRRIAQAQERRARLFNVPPVLLTSLGRLAGKSSAMERLCGNLQVDISKAHSVLGWVPKYRMQDCLRATVRQGQK